MMGITTKRWFYLDENTDENIVYAYTKLFGISPMVARVLVNRGITDAGDAKMFIDRDVSSLYSPFLINDMDKAVDRINKAIETKEQITIYGDYDVDGITSTAIMVSFLKRRGAKVNAYIPDRQNEGYGVNIDAIEKIIKMGTGLIITVDTGITAGDEVIFAKERGIDIIITDHHECKEVVPDAVAVINPKRIDCQYPFKDLAGVGVAFKLICALNGGRADDILEEYSDIIALGTIADVVSLMGENRIIAGVGLEKLRRNPNLGLKEVIRTIGSNPKWNSSAVVSYSIAPRINAAGRMSSAMTAVNLLLTKDSIEAQELAMELDRENRERQNQESVIFDEAVSMLKDEKYADKKFLILAKRGWHHGIIGVVASRICDKFQRSCILISIEDGKCKSSGRSMGGINLFEGLSACSDILENFGGHAYAAGFSIKEENIEELDRRLNEYAEVVLPSRVSRDLYIDVRVDLQDITLGAIKETEILGPYGVGNKMPTVAIEKVKIADIKTLSEGKHCRLIVEKDSKKLEVIAFGRSKIAKDFVPGDIVDIAGEMNINIYNGQSRVQIILEDIRISDSAVPERSDFVSVYKFLRAKGDVIEGDIMALAREVGNATHSVMGQEKFENILLVFEDVNILEYSVRGDNVKISLVPTEKGTKINITDSVVYKEISQGN
ncbi:MAG: single-stranded-DNA-specific exonuclease RecJ [Clostridia bacterium]|nr:single-stranded-DNA-specific exonuclease RecJ [Clostridia bacterium]